MLGVIMFALRYLVVMCDSGNEFTLAGKYGLPRYAKPVAWCDREQSFLAVPLPVATSKRLSLRARKFRWVKSNELEYEFGSNIQVSKIRLRRDQGAGKKVKEECVVDYEPGFLRNGNDAFLTKATHEGCGGHWIEVGGTKIYSNRVAISGSSANVQNLAVLTTCKCPVQGNCTASANWERSLLMNNYGGNILNTAMTLGKLSDIHILEPQSEVGFGRRYSTAPVKGYISFSFNALEPDLSQVPSVSEIVCEMAQAKSPPTIAQICASEASLFTTTTREGKKHVVLSNDADRAVEKPAKAPGKNSPEKAAPTSGKEQQKKEFDWSKAGAFKDVEFFSESETPATLLKATDNGPTAGDIFRKWATNKNKRKLPFRSREKKKEAMRRRLQGIEFHDWDDHEREAKLRWGLLDEHDKVTPMFDALNKAVEQHGAYQGTTSQGFFHAEELGDEHYKTLSRSKQSAIVSGKGTLTYDDLTLSLERSPVSRKSAFEFEKGDFKIGGGIGMNSEEIEFELETVDGVKVKHSQDIDSQEMFQKVGFRVDRPCDGRRNKKCAEGEDEHRDYSLGIGRSNLDNALGVNVETPEVGIGMLGNILDRNYGGRVRIKEFEIGVRHDFDEYVYQDKTQLGTEFYMSYKNFSLALGGDISDSKYGVGFGLDDYQISVLRDFDEREFSFDTQWKNGWELNLQSNFPDEYSTATTATVGFGNIHRAWIVAGGGVGQDGIPEFTTKIQTPISGVMFDLSEGKNNEKKLSTGISFGKTTFVWSSKVAMDNIRVPLLFGIEPQAIQHVLTPGYTHPEHPYSH